jgi:hypothetical protein
MRISSVSNRSTACAASATASAWFIFPTPRARATSTIRLAAAMFRWQDLPLFSKEIGYSELPMLEIISQTPDADIAESCRRLQQAGFA